MKCQYKQRLPEACEVKARVYVHAYGGKAWDGYYCEKHGPWIIKRRMRLIKKYKQNVVLRPITDWDKKRRKGHGKSKKST